MVVKRETGALWALVQTWMDLQPYPVSQRQLAGKISVAPSTLSEWKFCGGWPNPDDLARLAQEIGVPYEVALDAVLVDRGYRPRHPPQRPRKRA